MTDDQVRQNLRAHSIGLTMEEARKVETMLGRPPTVVEAVIWGIQGSEHCSYKSSRRFLKMFPTTGKHVMLGPGEDSGIVAITDGPAGKRWGLVVSHESHNHPSQIVPFEGAATGVGGTVRDVACMGARVIGCMDLLRLGSLKNPEARGIAREVIRGIAGYGNPLGIPNMGGDTVFDAAFDGNCLVNAVALGIVREDEIIHSYVPEEAAAEGYDIIIVGKPTDRSGFGGASFASVSMEEEKKEQNTGAVQEPNPFLERHLLISTYALFDWLVAQKKLDKISFKDLGAGGVVCASVEQVSSRGFGADVDLDAVHVSLPGLPPEVIACAETQERFCWVCHPSLTEAILRHYNVLWDLPSVAENARASVIGKVNGSGIYRLRHAGGIVCEAKSQDITSGLNYTRPTVPAKVRRSEPRVVCTADAITVDVAGTTFKTTIPEVFRAMLRHPNHASKQAAVVHYDKSVIGNSRIEAGEGDASMLTPLRDLPSYLPGGTHPGWETDERLAAIGVAFAGDGNPRYGRISAYGQGRMAALESMYNVSASGATPRALTDCLNYGNPEIPDQLAALEDGVRGISDAARGAMFDGECVPVISGNVSLYNGLPDGTAIPPSAIVCCIGVLPDASKALAMRLRSAGSSLVFIGERRDERGGSAYYEVLEEMAGAPRDALLGSRMPDPDAADAARQMQLIIRAAGEGLLLSSHDISDGGLLLALFEMTVPSRRQGGTIGWSIRLDDLGNLPSDALLFSQTPGFIVEVAADTQETFLALARSAGVSARMIGETTLDGAMQVSRQGSSILAEELRPLHAAWSIALERALHA